MIRWIFQLKKHWHNNDRLYVLIYCNVKCDTSTFQNSFPWTSEHANLQWKTTELSHVTWNIYYLLLYNRYTQQNSNGKQKCGSDGLQERWLHSLCSFSHTLTLTHTCTNANGHKFRNLHFSLSNVNLYNVHGESAETTSQIVAGVWFLE